MRMQVAVTPRQATHILLMLRIWAKLGETGRRPLKAEAGRGDSGEKREMQLSHL